MEQRQLGRTDLRVSALCLGTMTWGEQNDETQAFAQLDRARAAGVNFIDTAEMYPVPPALKPTRPPNATSATISRPAAAARTGSSPARSPAPETESLISATAS